MHLTGKGNESSGQLQSICKELNIRVTFLSGNDMNLNNKNNRWSITLLSLCLLCSTSSIANIIKLSTNVKSGHANVENFIDYGFSIWRETEDSLDVGSTSMRFEYDITKINYSKNNGVKSIYDMKTTLKTVLKVDKDDYVNALNKVNSNDYNSNIVQAINDDSVLLDLTGIDIKKDLAIVGKKNNRKYDKLFNDEPRSLFSVDFSYSLLFEDGIDNKFLGVALTSLMGDLQGELKNKTLAKQILAVDNDIEIKSINQIHTLTHDMKFWFEFEGAANKSRKKLVEILGDTNSIGFGGLIGNFMPYKLAGYDVIDASIPELIDHRTAESITVPEPSTLAIFALGMIGLASRRFNK